MKEFAHHHFLSAGSGGPTLLWSARETPEHDHACRGEVGEQANERAPEKRWFSAFPFFLSPPETRESPVGRRALRMIFWTPQSLPDCFQSINFECAWLREKVECGLLRYDHPDFQRLAVKLAGKPAVQLLHQ